VTQDDRATRRANALDAARAILVEGGDAKLSMRKLAQASGAAVNTLYAMFGTREGILEAIVDDALADYLGLMTRSPEISTSPTEQLAWVLETSAAYVTGHPARGASMYLAADALRVLGRVSTQTSDAILTPLLARAVEAGELRAETSPHHASAMVSTANTHLTLSWARGELDADHFRARCRYELATILCAHASPGHAARLQARLAQASEALARFG
jgi:AcrR family transcriptional regulator